MADPSNKQVALAVVLAASGLSKVELARELGIGRTALWEILAGHRTPSPETRDQLFKIVGQRVFEGATKEVAA